MTHSDATRSILPLPQGISQAIAQVDLHRVLGGAGLDFAAIRQQAEPYCPSTAAKYARVDPASVNRSLALRVGNECLTEMGPFKATFARGPIQGAINRAFPK